MSVALLTLIVMLLIPISPTWASAQVEILSVELQTGKPESYFRLRLRWPDEGVPDRYRTFLEKNTESQGAARAYDWPVDAVELVPQDPEVQRVFRVLSDGPEPVPQWRLRSSRPPQELSFVGRFSGRPAAFDLRLRCPAPDGSYRWIPLGLDLLKAKRTKELQKAFWRAEADMLAALPAPADQSFYAYAWERLRLRLGKDGKQLLLPRSIRGAGRRGMYEILTGGLALQESLQLDRMREGRTAEGKRNIPIDSIEGVTVKSHPWADMIGADKPKIDPEAALVPVDQYYIRFESSKGFRRFFDAMHEWGGSLLGLVEVGGRDFGTRDKIERQICIRASWLSDMLGPAVVESLVLTGSDPYLREGSDLSVIFRLKSPKLFETAVGRYLAEARRDNADLKESRFTFQGVDVQVLATPDRRVNCHRAKLGADYVVYSNSRAAIERIIETFVGKRANLASSLDFVYLRKIYPFGDEQEDGFIFLSDAWLRYLSGPRLRIAEKRRIEAMTSLEMIKNAALFYLWEHPGSAVPRMDVLVAQGYLDLKQLRPEAGDRFDWDPARFEASSKRYGRLGYLRPVLEMKVDEVSAQEKSEYERFRDNYQDYWRRYFDPVALRVRSVENLDLDLSILPLIDNSEYQRVTANVGGAVVPLEPHLRQGPVILHWTSHLNPDGREYKEMQSIAVNMLPGRDRATVEWMGERVEAWVEDHPVLGKLHEDIDLGELFSIPVVLAVEVKSKFGLAAFLVAFQSMVRTSAPGLIRFEALPAYKGHDFTAIRAEDESPEAGRLRDAAITYGVVGDMLYVSTQLASLKRVVDAKAGKADPLAVAKAFGGGAEGHMGIRVHPDQAGHALRLVGRELSRLALEAEQEHLRNLELVARTVGLGPEARVPVEKVLGYRVASVLGNRYRWLSSEGAVESSGNGTLWRFKAPRKIPPDSPLGRLLGDIRSLRATLELSEHGLRSKLGLRRR